METQTSLYRIWYATSNNRSELGRARAQDIDEVIDLVKREYLKPDTQFYDIDYQGSEQVFMMIDICVGCEHQGSESDSPCDFCETSEYVEIVEDTDIEPEYKTIFGTNEFYDLTDPEQTQKALNWNNMIAEAWDHSPQRGVSALIVQTIKDHPELEKGFSPELIKKSRRDLGQ